MENETFAQYIESRVLAVDRESMTLEERAVMGMLWKTFKDGNGEKITQRQIAAHERWLGCHPEHEADLPINKEESTLRQVRQIIRNLRIKYRMPILANVKGYWIPREHAEAVEYLETQEREVRAQIAAWAETYKAMKEAFNLSNSFLEQIYERPTNQQSSVGNGAQVG